MAKPIYPLRTAAMEHSADDMVMEEKAPPRRTWGKRVRGRLHEAWERLRPFHHSFFLSLTFKNLAVFLFVFPIAIAPLVHSYWKDAQENRINILSARLELIAMESIRQLPVEEIAPLVTRSMTNTELHRSIVQRLRRIQGGYDVDNAVLMRRNPDGKFSFMADGNNQFYVSQPVFIHRQFPQTYTAANKAWSTGKPARTGLFGLGTFEYLQVYAPIVADGEVAAVLLINKFAEHVDQAIRAKTLRLLLLTAALALAGAVGFWFFSNRMLLPLLRLKDAALRMAGGDLNVDIPPMRRRDEVSDLNESFRTMVRDLRQSREESDRYNAQLERTLARVRLMEDLEKNLFKFVPREVSAALQKDPEALERGKIEQDVTVLFLDIEGSTLLAESLGPKSSDRLIEVYFSRFLDSIYENQGDITETAGDGLMMIFQGSDPGKHAMNAIKAAIAIQESAAAIQSQLNPEEERIRINIGICSGSALVGFTKYEAITGTRVTFTASGLTTIMAARLADMATQGSVLIGEGTMGRVAQSDSEPLASVSFLSLGKQTLKNIRGAVEVYRLERV
jgi:class 3 adenylate cyclase